MAIPRAVREAADKADELHKRRYEALPESEPNPTDQSQESAPESSDPSDVDVHHEATSKTTQEGNGGNPPTSEPPAPPKDEPWEQRYKVIEGKYRAEVPRMAAENRDLRNKVDDLAAQVESMKSQAVSSKAPLINEADREKYGDDLLDVIKRAAQQETAGKDVEIADLQRKLDSVQSKTAQSLEVSFYDRLNSMAPDWVSINSEDGFLRWLDEYDELTGRTRQDLLSMAEQDRDAERVARFFNKWKSGQSGQQTNQSNHTQDPARHQAPDTRRNVQAPPGKRYFTRGEIGQFYSDCRRGIIKNKDMVAMEAEIHLAQIEGRIR